MHDTTAWLWPLFFGVMAVIALALRGVKARRPHNVLPIIQRRRELQEELNSLVPEDVGIAVLREASRQLRRPSWDIKVLEAAVHRAQGIESRKAKKLGGRAPAIRSI